jgi:bifunctional non-homologous end joining protein LigD
MDNLARYHAKRDFRITAEPRGKRVSSAGEPIFVVQRHHASHLHYDFRLELDGTLKSWAVPKGPSLDPADKRLAVHVEDHPLDYADFEGTIPARQYGAGEVVLWDRGTWEADGDAAAAYKAGKIKFELQGEKLRGHWMLVRTRYGSNDGDSGKGKENWLLIKERDEEARSAADYDVTVARPESVKKSTRRKTTNVKTSKAKIAEAKSTPRTSKIGPGAGVRAALPTSLAPQLATLVESAPADGDWAYELKLDGYRILSCIDASGRARLLTRNGLDWTERMPQLARALKALALKNTWLDGEVVVLDPQGKPDFQLLQNAFAEESPATIQYFLFDVPFAKGYDLRAEPWTVRRTVLDQLIRDNRSPLIGLTEALTRPVAEIWENVCAVELEGLIGKRRDAPYTSGRSATWIKLKCHKRQEFVIVGYTDPQGSRSGFGALLLGVNEKGKLRYAGRVGTGFDETRLKEMHRSLSARRVHKPLFENPPTGAEARGVHWIKPDLVCEVSFAQWTRGGTVRQAVFHGLRSDKPAKSIGVEQAAAVPVASIRASTSSSQSAASTARAARDGSVTLASGIRVTHPARVVDPTSGLTKLDLVQYYERIADHLLPHLKERPVALLRVPDSIKEEQFFQKHLRKESIPGALMLEGLDPGHPPLVALPTAKAIVGAAQMNVVELHTWNALAGSIDRPDRILFDLDPDPKLPWGRMIDAVKLTRTLLEGLGLASFLKTSGGKGMHIVVPLKRRHTWEAAKRFSQAVSQYLAQTFPDRFSAKMGPQNRIGKIFVDYLRNGRGATTVSAFSARARPGLPVSVPISWAELETIGRSDAWNILTVGDYLAARRIDPWADYEKSRQMLTGAARKLNI